MVHIIHTHTPFLMVLKVAHQCKKKGLESVCQRFTSVLYCADGVIHIQYIGGLHATKKSLPEDLDEGFSVDVLERSWSRPETPSSWAWCWQGGGAGTQSFRVSLSPATPHSRSVPGGVPHHLFPLPSPGLAKPTNHPEERADQRKSIIVENRLKNITEK